MSRARDVATGFVESERLVRDVNDNGQTQDDTSTLEILSATNLVEQYPKLRQPLLHGLLRRGETANLIGAQKMGKSWNVLHAGIAFAIGGEWLGFRAEQSRVLLVDNELHRETLAHRLKKVCEALHVRPAELNGTLDVMPLRGQLSDVYRIGERLSTSQHYDVVIIDALYRALPKGADENSNSDIAGIYNALDYYSTEFDSAFIVVHHSSKGAQTGKAVTDVGSGAGAQSRAVDTHIVLRSHETDGVLVFEAACRSWPPLEPRCLRLEFPLWLPADEHDPTKLRTARPAKVGPTDSQVRAFVERFISTSPRPKGAIELAAYEAGHTQRDTRELLKLAIDLGYAYRHVLGAKVPHQIATVPPTASACQEPSEERKP